MAKRDYYEVLGVSKNAGAEEIKKAFRNLARDLHPDNKVSGDEAAFKELAEAYEVLTDEQKRSLYDRFGHEGVKGATRSFDDVDFSSFAGFGMDDLIDIFFGGGLRSSGRQTGLTQGAHLKYDLSIDFLEAVFGVEKKISIKRLEECTACNGGGAVPGSNITSCTTCGGMGQVQQVVNSWFGQSIRVMGCPQCQGSGKRIEKPCRDCRGEGLVKKTKEFDLPVPAGIESSFRLRVAGGGDKGRFGGPFGDLYVVVHINEHEYFVRDGNTIHLSQPISFSMAALGGEMLVPTVDGSKPIKITAGTQAGATVTMKHMGVPRLGNTAWRGDQIVHLIVQTPTKLKSEEKELLQKLAQLRGESLDIVLSDQLETESRSKAKSSKNGKESVEQEVQDKDDPSLLDKIVGAFKPKNGENEGK